MDEARRVSPFACCPSHVDQVDSLLILLADQPKLDTRTIGRILDRAVRIFRRNIKAFVGVVALVQLPVLAVMLLYIWRGSVQEMVVPFSLPWLALLEGIDTFSTANSGSFLLLSLLQHFARDIAAQVVVTRLAAESALGRRMGLKDAVRASGGRWLPLLGAWAIVLLITVALYYWTQMPCIGWLTGGSMLAYLWFMAGGLLAPVVVLEKRSPWGAFKRAWDLARRRFGWLLGFMAVLTFFNLVIVSAPAGVLNLAAEGIVGGDRIGEAGVWSKSLQAVIYLVPGLLYVPLRGICLALAYLALRVHTEGFDLALQAAEGEPQADVFVSAPQVEAGRLIGAWDIGRFILMTLVVIGSGLLLWLLLAAFVLVMGLLGG